MRPFEPGDQAAARSLILDGMREHWGDDFDASFNLDIDDIAASFAAGVFLVAAAGGQIVGTGAMTPGDGGIAIVTRMATSAAYRRKGVARMLLAALVEQARGRGCARIVLGTNIRWEDAIQFYTAFGFKEMRRSAEGVVFSMEL